MKSTLKYIILAVVALTATTTMASCQNKVFSIVKDSDNVSRNINISEHFNGICTRSSVDIEYTEGAQAITLSAPKEIINLIEVKVSNEVLTVTVNSQNVIAPGSYNMKLYVTAPNVNKFITEGSGDITVKSIEDNKDISVSTKGSGDIEMPALKCVNFNANTMGSGDISAQAVTCTQADLSTKGSGDIGINKINATELLAITMGSGDIRLGSGNVTKAELSTFGSGDITAKNVKIKTINIVEKGSGDVIR